MEKQISIIKKNGEKEFYSESKLRSSLANSGADKKTIDDILLKVDDFIYGGITTKELFKFSLKELSKSGKNYASKYNIKNALMELRLGGGYVFEKFISRILNYRGYETILNKIINGEHITHEVDVIAKKDKDTIMVECKHHNKPWLGCHIQTALYTYARFLDVKKTFTSSMLVTNTKFSNQIIKYSNGVGLRLMGWKHPREDSLEINIERSKLYPITVLNISKPLKIKCMENDILTVKDFIDLEPLIVMRKLEIEENMVKRITKEISNLIEFQKGTDKNGNI